MFDSIVAVIVVIWSFLIYIFLRISRTRWKNNTPMILIKNKIIINQFAEVMKRKRAQYNWVNCALYTDFRCGENEREICFLSLAVQRMFFFLLLSNRMYALRWVHYRSISPVLLALNLCSMYFSLIILSQNHLKSASSGWVLSCNCW